MWWMDLVLGFWNGITAWIVFFVHLFGVWSEFPLYDVTRAGGWYDFGFLVGTGPPFLGAVGAGRRSGTTKRASKPIAQPI